MHRIVQFMSTIDSFNEHELELFCQKLYEIYGKKEIICKSLLFLTLHEFKHNTYDHVNTINRINTDILDLRRSKKTEAKEIEPKEIEPNTNLFKLTPSPIVSHIATFLQNSELFKFMKSNRYNYISCVSTPTTIQQFNHVKSFLNNFAESSFITQKSKISQLQMVKKVSLNANDFNVRNFGLNGIEWIWNKLDVLSIRNLRFERYNIIDLSTTDAEISENILINILKNIQVKHLLLQSISLNAHSFANILSANKTLEYLSIDRFNGSLHAASQQIMAQLQLSHLSEIKALALFNCCEFGDRLLSSLSNRLQSLHIQSCNSISNARPQENFLKSSHNDIHYTKLQELCISDVDDVTILHILKSATDIQRIHYCIPHSTEMLQYMIERLIHLEYLSLEQITDWYFITKTFRNACKRTNMKIRIKYTEDYFPNSIENNLMEFITALSGSVSNDFLFECVFDYCMYFDDSEYIGVDDDILNGIKNKLKQLKTKYEVKINSNKKIFAGFVISNKNNSMHGYGERWLYSCEKCSNPIHKWSSLNPGCPRLQQIDK